MIFLAASAASVLSITFGLSYTLLIFAGPLSPYLSYGIAATFIGSAVLAAMIGLGSSLPFAIAGPDSSTVAVTSILAASLVERIVAADPSAALLAPVLITLGLSTIVTGIVLCGLGLTRMGRAIRYVPYPVVGGFLGATGLLIVLGAIRVITDHPAAARHALTLHEYRHDLGTGRGLRDGAGAVSDLAPLAPAVWIAGHPDRRRHCRAPGVLDHRAFRRTGPRDWAGPSSRRRPPPSCCRGSADELARYPWSAVPDLLGNVIAVIFVTAASTLFNTTGVEVAVHREANLERELNVTGARQYPDRRARAATPDASRSAAPSSISATAAAAGFPG